MYSEVRYLPEWFPGAGFQRFARECKEAVNVVTHDAYEYVLQQLVSI